MALGMGQINAVRDPALRMLLTELYQQLAAQQALITTLQANSLQRSATVPVQVNNRLTGVVDPLELTDAVNVRTLKKYVTMQLSTFAIAANTHPPGVPGIPGDPNTVPDGSLPLPASAGTVAAVFAANPGFVATSCQNVPGGTWDLMDAIVDALRGGDTRWGYNGKRGNINDPSLDALAYDYGAVAGGEGSTSVYIVDVIAGHCGTNPQPAYNDVTVFAPGVWTGRGRF
jgi:hypothetical protein